MYPRFLDHLVIATPDLEAGLKTLRNATGVQLEPGGVHPHWGTRNYLATLGGGVYLELIGADPENTEFGGIRPFQVDQVGTTQAVTWALEVPNLERSIEAARIVGADLGEPRSASRRTADDRELQWRLTPPIHTSSGLIPFLIDWQGMANPAHTLSAALEFVALKISHPKPQRIQAVLEALGTEPEINVGPEKIYITVQGPAGRITL